MKLRNNPFVKMDDSRPSFGSKPILREAKLSFTVNQSTATSLCNANKDSLFSTNLNNGSSSNSIIMPNNKGKTTRKLPYNLQFNMNIFYLHYRYLSCVFIEIAYESDIATKWCHLM